MPLSVAPLPRTVMVSRPEVSTKAVPEGAVAAALSKAQRLTGDGAGGSGSGGPEVGSAPAS